MTKVDALNEQAGIKFYERTPEHYAMTSDDRLLFIAGQRIVEFDLSRTDRVDHVPTVFLEKVFVNGTDIYETEYKKFLRAWGEQTQAISFLPTERSVSFTFSGNSVEDEHLYYSWRLRGLDEKWSAPTALTEVQFNDLKPGNYVFDLKVCDDAGNCGRLKAPWKFAIAKPFYAKSWFWVVAFWTVFIAGLFLYKQRKRRQRKSELIEKKRLEAELNALTLEQKSLQLQMNPHFIFNTLQALRSHIQEEKLEQARTNLNRFAKLIRSMLDVNRSELITLEEELEFLQAFADVQSITLHKPLDFAIEVEESVELHAIKIPPMLLQPVVENAIKYGGNGDTVKVDVHVAIHNEVLQVTVRDNGTGFGSHASAHKSAALDILKNRLMRMGQGGGIDIGGGKEGAVVVVRIPV